MTVCFDSSIDYHTLVYCYRISVYRPRRKRGRIKCEVEKRHSVVGEQKIDERAGDVLRFGFYGDKNSLSTPNVTNCLLSTRNPPPPHSTFMQAKRLRLTTADTPQLSSTVVIPEGRNESRSSLIPYVGELDAAAASQSARRTQRHDDLATMSNTRCQGTTGRYGSWIQRSPTHTQRESSNAKFHCQWHERVVVFCFGVLTCAMFTLLITKPTTHISLGNKTHFIEEFLLFYHPFRFSFSFPAPKQASPTSSRRSRPTIARKLVKDNNCAKGRPNYLGCRRCFKELPAQIAPDQGHIILSARDGKILRWFDPTNDHHFSGEHISISETFPVSLLIDSFYPTFGHEIRDDSHEGGLLFLIF